MDEPAPESPTDGLRIFAAAAYAWALTYLLVSRVTMITMYAEWDVPAYGFPLPAFGWTGVSSGVWWVAAVPLLVDVVVALCVAGPLAWLITGRMHGRGRGITAIAALLFVAYNLGPVPFEVAVGILRPRWFNPSGIEQPECRSAWFGTAQAEPSPRDTCR